METVADLDRITRNPAVMGGKPCIRGMRVTVGMLVGLIASGHRHDAVLAAYPYLEEEDIRQALAYSAWRVEEIEIPLPDGRGGEGVFPLDYFVSACGFLAEDLGELTDPLPESVAELDRLR
jgi:uncharacterized protein (DUF433 family)